MEALRRYTSINNTLEYLNTEQLNFSAPEYWEDQNDKFIIDICKEKREIAGQPKYAQLLCFTQSEETYLHWKVYGKDGHGACLIFNPEKLNSIATDNNIIHQKVEYLKLNEALTKTITLDTLPFIKRFPYQSEKEYRYIHFSDAPTKDRYKLGVPLGCVEKIILGHKIPKKECRGIRAKVERLLLDRGLTPKIITTGIVDTKSFQKKIKCNSSLFQ